MADRYFPNTLGDYVVPLQNVGEDSHVQAEAGRSPEDVTLKAAIALRDEVSFNLSGASSFCFKYIVRLLHFDHRYLSLLLA